MSLSTLISVAFKKWSFDASLLTQWLSFIPLSLLQTKHFVGNLRLRFGCFVNCLTHTQLVTYWRVLEFRDRKYLLRLDGTGTWPDVASFLLLTTQNRFLCTANVSTGKTDVLILISSSFKKFCSVEVKWKIFFKF